MVPAVGDLHHLAGEEVPSQHVELPLALFRAALHAEDLRAEGCQARDDALVVVVAERDGVPLGCA